MPGDLTPDELGSSRLMGKSLGCRAARKAPLGFFVGLGMPGCVRVEPGAARYLVRRGAPWPNGGLLRELGSRLHSKMLAPRTVLRHTSRFDQLADPLTSPLAITYSFCAGVRRAVIPCIASK